MADELITSAVAEHVSQAVGVVVTEVAAVHGSVANLDFRVRLADRTMLIVKVGPRSEMAAEAWACRRLAQCDLPIPEVRHLELDSGIAGKPTLVLSVLAGTPSEDRHVLQQAGEVFQRVHAQHLPGWGSIVVESARPDHEVRGRHDSWRTAVLHQLAGLPDLVDAGIIDAELASGATDCVAVAEVLDYSGPGVLLHNDLKPAHLFGLDSPGAARLSGVIDWGDASVGDPLADLAKLSMTGRTAIDAFCDGYGIALTPTVREILPRYRILWNVTALTYEYRAGGDWFDVYRQRIADDIRLLTSTRTRA